MPTCNRLDSETLGSRPIKLCPKTSQDIAVELNKNTILGSGTYGAHCGPHWFRSLNFVGATEMFSAHKLQLILSKPTEIQN